MEAMKTARIDALLAMIGLFRDAREFVGSDDIRLPESYSHLSAFDDTTQSLLTNRASKLNALTREQRRVWFALWRERLRRRGLTARLDPNVHAEQIAEVMKPEPQSVRSIIETHLPAEIASKVAIILQASEGPVSWSGTRRAQGVSKANPRLIEIVRERFLARFVAYEDLFEPTKSDRFTTKQLGNLIWNLGLREIARFCRGIEKIENLAGFVQRFEEDTGKSIGLLIPSMKNVEIERVKVAESRITKVFDKEKISDDQVRRVGMLIFAEYLCGRSDEAVRFNLQKLPVAIERELREYVNQGHLNDTTNTKSVSMEIAVLTEEMNSGGAT